MEEDGGGRGGGEGRTEGKGEIAGDFRLQGSVRIEKSPRLERFGVGPELGVRVARPDIRHERRPLWSDQTFGMNVVPPRRDLRSHPFWTINL